MPPCRGCGVAGSPVGDAFVAGTVSGVGDTFAVDTSVVDASEVDAVVVDAVVVGGLEGRCGGVREVA